MSQHFDAGWLALREPFDHAARSVALAQQLAASLPIRPSIIDLGAGSGSLFRYLAPLIARRQDWLLLDADTALLDDAFGRTAAWARRHGYAATASGNELQISTPHGLWRMQTRAHALHEPVNTSADAMVCSALLDLVSAAWLDKLVAQLAVPFLACLTVDGRDTWRPRHPHDARTRAAFRRDQSRDKGLGPALGANASAYALRAFAARGFVTASAPGDWRIPRTALAMQRALIEGRGAGDATWQQARLRQALRGRLAITIGHRDILALPPGG